MFGSVALMTRRCYDIPHEILLLLFSVCRDLWGFTKKFSIIEINLVKKFQVDGQIFLS